MNAATEAVRTSVPTALILRDGRVLLARRQDGKSFGGCWETPGGKAEPGETDEEALARELLEELGVAAVVGEAVDVVLLDPPVTLRSYRIAIHLCTIAGEPKPLASAEIRWFSREECRGLRVTPATKVALQAWARLS